MPSRIYSHDQRPYTHLYSFNDLVALRLISILRWHYGLSLQSTRVAVDYVREDVEPLWSERHIWIDGKNVGRSDPGSDSAVRIELAPIAEEVKAGADKLWERTPEDFGKIEQRRNVMGGTPVVKGTRVPVSTVVNLAAAGWGIGRILRAYPSLEPEDIRAVLQIAEDRREVA